MNKNILVGLAIFLILGGGLGFKYYQDKHPETFKEEVKVVPPSTPSEQGTVTVPPTDSRPAVSIDLPQKPLNGTMKGVIEVGASGFNSFVVNIDKEKHWEIVSKDFGASLAYEGLANKEDLVKGIKDYAGNIFNKGVAGRNLYFVMSSGALKNPKTADVAEAIAKMGYIVNKVTADQEGKYALKAALNPAYKEESFVVDIGSGNTKISWYEGVNLKTVEAPGAKYYQNGMTDQQAYDDLKSKASLVPSNKRAKCFVIGGVPYSLAKEVRQNETDRYTILKSPDDYSAGDDVKKKSGLNLYRAIIDGTSTNTFIFDWDANFTIGLLMSMN